jgi:D-3-phosphoglycerate dehydrogenase
VIGNIGTILGRHNINIASIKVGRDQEGETGMTLLKLDYPLPQAILDEMSAFPHVLSVKQLELP